jgi:hypothetical protein
MGKIINEEILSILSKVTINGNNIELTCGQLDRKQYQAVNEVLENIGGKWNKKAKAHIYTDDPTDALEQVLLLGEIVQPKKYGYFPTPPELAKTIVELAEINDGDFILEPSAGQGHIVDHITIGVVDCVELLPDNIKVLKDKGYNVLHEGSFLDLQPEAKYDKIIMNPPFEKQADIDHVTHAFKFLKHGGRLVSIMASSVGFRQNKKTLDFRGILDTHGYTQDNPVGSFKESGTMVNTVTVVLNN